MRQCVRRGRPVGSQLGEGGWSVLGQARPTGLAHKAGWRWVVTCGLSGRKLFA